MKENIFKKIKRKWDELPVEDKKFCIGCGIGGLVTSVISGVVSAKRDKMWVDAGVNVADQESRKAYYKGMQDGQIKAYQDLLMRPDMPFKKMGMDVKKF